MYDEYGNLIEEDSVETPIEQPVALPPKLLDRYKKGLSTADQGVDDANSYSDNLKYANTGIGILNDFTNSQKSDIVLKNRMSDLGKKPTIIEADRPKYDRSILDNMGKEKVASAEKSRAKVDSSFQNEMKMDDYSRKSEAAARSMDPMSDESVGAREYFKRLVPGASSYPGVEKMSAAQIEKVAPKLYEKYKNDQADATKRRNADLTHAMQGLRADEIRNKKPAEKTPSADQGKVASFGKRLEQSEGVFSELAKGGYNRADYTSAAAANIMPKSFTSEQLKKQSQAERNFVNAVLRRESGAAIAPEEFASAEQQYFPRAGDTADVITQKANNRKLVQESMKREAGNAWDQRPVSEIVGQEGPKTFPMTVRKDGKIATVKDENELNNATAKGWK